MSNGTSVLFLITKCRYETRFSFSYSYTHIYYEGIEHEDRRREQLILSLLRFFLFIRIEETRKRPREREKNEGQASFFPNLLLQPFEGEEKGKRLFQILLYLDLRQNMFFLIAFGWLVAASFAFVLAILTPHWITIQTLASTRNVTVQRGVFYVCDLISTDSPFETKRCTSILEQTKSFEPFKWRYGTYRSIVTRCSNADVCSRICDLVVIDRHRLCGIEYHRRLVDWYLFQCATKKSMYFVWPRHAQFLRSIHLWVVEFDQICTSLILSLVCTSIVVWILLIVETLVLGYTVNTSTLHWPLWLAVGASGGYLMSSLTMLISLCAVVRRQRRRDKDLLEARNHF